jgi:hypothetical protein
MLGDAMQASGYHQKPLILKNKSICTRIKIRILLRHDVDRIRDRCRPDHATPAGSGCHRYAIPRQPSAPVDGHIFGLAYEILPETLLLPADHGSPRRCRAA